jgi:hypothetical protein
MSDTIHHRSYEENFLTLHVFLHLAISVHWIRVSVEGNSESRGGANTWVTSVTKKKSKLFETEEVLPRHIGLAWFLSPFKNIIPCLCLINISQGCGQVQCYSVYVLKDRDRDSLWVRIQTLDNKEVNSEERHWRGYSVWLCNPQKFTQFN